MIKHVSTLLFSTGLLALTACGGEKNASPVNNENTSHPEFSWAKVAVSNNYSPSGDVTDLTPTFSWKEASGSTVYNLGHQGTDGSGWKEYTIPAAEAGCATGTVCNYKPANHVFNVGEQKVWWVRGKVNNQWQDWSAAHVFNITDGSGGGNGGNTNTPSTLTPSNGSTITNSTPQFTWQPITNASSLVIGLEKQDGSNWKSYTINSSSTSFTPSSNINNGDYTWWMRAELDNGSWTNWSNGADFTVDASGGGSSTLKTDHPKGSISTTQPSFRWSVVTNASEYKIGFEANNEWQEFTTSPCISTTWCGLSPRIDFNTGNTYTWYVKAKVNGNWQEWTSGTTFSVSLTQPGQLFIFTGHCHRAWGCAFNRRGTTKLEMSFRGAEDKSKVKEYYIYRDGVKIDTEPASTTDDRFYFTDTGLSPNTAYTYTVKSVDAVGNILATGRESVISTRVIDQLPPPAPQSLTGTYDQQTGKVNLTWEMSIDPDGIVKHYTIYKNGSILVKDRYPRHTYLYANVSSGQTYTFQVQAVDQAGHTSEKSSPFTITIQ